jgi:hypothetical protein
MFFSYVGNLPVHSIAPIMAVASAHEQPRPLYEGVYMVGGYDQGDYYLTWVAT